MAILMVKKDSQQWIYDEFPYLRSEKYIITSLNDDAYNCIAWAAGDNENPWWPDDDPENGIYWPPDAPREHTLNAFILAFKTRGFEPCEFNLDLEVGFEKVVIYVDDYDKPQHMARQVESGAWTSKLGRAWDIEHVTIQGVECIEYGKAKYMLKRAKL